MPAACKFGADLATSSVGRARWPGAGGAGGPGVRRSRRRTKARASAEFVVDQGAKLEYVTPERLIGVDVGGINYPAYYKALYAAKATFTVNHRLKGIRRDGNKLVAVLGNDYDKSETERRVDQVIAEHGTLPAAEVYFALKDQSSQSRRARHRRPDRQPAAGPGAQPRRPVPAVPRRRRGQQPQHPRRALRFPPALSPVLTTVASGFLAGLTVSVRHRSIAL